MTDKIHLKQDLKPDLKPDLEPHGKQINGKQITFPLDIKYVENSWCKTIRSFISSPYFITVSFYIIFLLTIYLKFS